MIAVMFEFWVEGANKDRYFALAEEMRAFLADRSPNAYERLVDRLLASPHYGERWARHWLDIVRFGESQGFDSGADGPSANLRLFADC